MSDAPHPSDPASLRAEHDALAARLGARASVDAARRGLVLLFLGLLGVGTCIALAWDRWGPPKAGEVKVIPPGGPFFLYVATAVTLVLLVVAIRALRAQKRLQLEEDGQFERLKALRRELGIDG
ncbi:MAG: hypothetical protein QM767_16475 [Anaeromyxobacter sp.]